MANVEPHATCSKTADALYVSLSEGEVARTRIVNDLRIIDLAAGGRVLGIEFIDANPGVPFSSVYGKKRGARLSGREVRGCVERAPAMTLTLHSRQLTTILADIAHAAAPLLPKSNPYRILGEQVAGLLTDAGFAPLATNHEPRPRRHLPRTLDAGCGLVGAALVQGAMNRAPANYLIA